MVCSDTSNHNIIMFLYLYFLGLWCVGYSFKSFLKYLHFFNNKKYYFLLFYKIIKIISKFYKTKNNNLLLLIFKPIYFCVSRFI